MSSECVAWAFRQAETSSGKPIPALEKFVLVALASYASADGLAWPSVETLVGETKLSERRIRKALTFIRTEMVLSVRAPQPGVRTTTYSFPLEALHYRRRKIRQDIELKSPPTGLTTQPRVQDVHPSANGWVQDVHSLKNGWLHDGSLDGARRDLDPCTSGTQRVHDMHPRPYETKRETLVETGRDANTDLNHLVRKASVPPGWDYDSVPSLRCGHGGDATVKQGDIVGAMMKTWNRHCGELRPIKEMTSERAEVMENSFPKFDNDLARFESFVTKAARSLFLTGRAGSSFRASIEWCLKDKNRIAILEAGYEDDPSRDADGFTRVATPL